MNAETGYDRRAARPKQKRSQLLYSVTVLACCLATAAAGQAKKGKDPHSNLDQQIKRSQSRTRRVLHGYCYGEHHPERYHAVEPLQRVGRV